MHQTSIVVTHYAPPGSPITSVTLTSTNPTSELASPLSGTLAADYRLVSSAPGDVIITAIDSYKERHRKTKAGLSAEVVEEKKKMEMEKEKVEEKLVMLLRAHMYPEILSGKPFAALTHPSTYQNHLTELNGIYSLKMCGSR